MIQNSLFLQVPSILIITIVLLYISHPSLSYTPNYKSVSTS